MGREGSRTFLLSIWHNPWTNTCSWVLIAQSQVFSDALVWVLGVTRASFSTCWMEGCTEAWAFKRLLVWFGLPGFWCRQALGDWVYVTGPFSTAPAFMWLPWVLPSLPAPLVSSSSLSTGQAAKSPDKGCLHVWGWSGDLGLTLVSNDLFL